jgi:hypothetical protein
MCPSDVALHPMPLAVPHTVYHLITSSSPSRTSTRLCDLQSPQHPAAVASSVDRSIALFVWPYKGSNAHPNTWFAPHYSLTAWAAHILGHTFGQPRTLFPPIHAFCHCSRLHSSPPIPLPCHCGYASPHSYSLL